MPLQVGAETKSRLRRQRVSFPQFLLLLSSMFLLFFFKIWEGIIICSAPAHCRWFPVTAKHTETCSEQEEVKWGWELAWWISLFDVRAEMKSSRGSSSSSFSPSPSFTLSHSFHREKVDESHAVCKMCLLKAKDCLVCGPSVLFTQVASTFVIFYCCNLWLIVTPHISWMSVCPFTLSPCLLSAMKPVCSQRSYWPVSGSITHPHKSNKVHMFHQARSIQTTHTVTHIHTEQSLVGISLGPS